MSVPVYIYWLLDTRPATIAAGYHSGYPFYCGKALDPEKRLKQHVCAARSGRGKKSKRIRHCGPHIRIHVVEVLPDGKGWQNKERRWIKLVRFCFPDNCNVSSGGGSGRALHEMTKAQRANLRRALRNSDRCKWAKERRERAEAEKKKSARYRIKQHRLKQHLSVDASPSM